MSLVEYRPRLPLPANIDQSQWRVLTEVIFPFAKSAQSIMLALDYCKVRNLDVMKKPVNIVPIWSSELRREVETIWPAIGETQITAARSKEWAGLDPARYGPKVAHTFQGRRKDRNGGWEDFKTELEYPDWCEVTVYRMIAGQRCPFTERVYWMEAYGRMGGSAAPNAMWSKRPHGQLQKVAKAASLRAAFPEEAPGATDEEVAGSTLEDAREITEPAHRTLPPLQQPAPPIAPTGDGLPPHDPDTGEIIDAPPTAPEQTTSATYVPLLDGEPWSAWGQRFIAMVRAQTELDGLEAVLTDNAQCLEAMQGELPKMHGGLERTIQQHKLKLLPANPLQ